MGGQAKIFPRIERRSGADRRKRAHYNLKQIIKPGTRENVRREADRERIMFLDRYSPTLFICITLILVLSILDAVFTLYLVNKGATEINPVMAHYINVGPRAFLMVKYGLTCFSIMVLLLCSNVFLKRFRVQVRTLFTIMMFIFVGVVLWQLFLIYHVVA
jgi:hypothetical protein